MTSLELGHKRGQSKGLLLSISICTAMPPYPHTLVAYSGDGIIYQHDCLTMGHKFNAN